MHKNRKKGLVLFTSLLVGLTLVPDAGRTVAADSLSGLGGDAASTDDARFRREVGLRADAGYMDQLERREREGTGSFDRSYGALLTDEEAGELRERNDQATANAAVVRSYFGESNPLDAGMFLDNRDGVLTVLVTGQAERVTSDLRATVPHAERLRVSTARTSLAALDDLTGRVSEDIGALREQGIEVTSVSTDQRTNTVTVGVAQATARIRSALERRYAGAPITVVEVSSMPTGTTGRNAPPFRGAQYIDNTMTACSNGFVARRPGTVTNIYYVVTAGHCGGGVWTQAGYPEGQADVNLYYTGSRSDAMRINVPFAEMSREVFKNASSYQIITAQEGYMADVVGQVTCVSGYKTEISCGTITTTNTTVTYTIQGVTTTLYVQREATYVNIPGDSGGSVFNGGLAKGINSGKRTYGDGTTRSLYSHIAEVMPALGLSTATSCEGAATPHCR